MSSNFKMNDIEKLVAGIKTGLLKKYKTEEKASHTFIDGGKLYIPYEKLKKVYKELNTNLINPPLTERLGAYNDTFKFFIDVDDETANVERILEITEKYANQLFILDDKQKRYTVWKNSTKNKYHIIYQFLVNKDDAVNLIKLIVKDYPEFKADKSVYNSGLRLPLCNKDKKDAKDNSVYRYYSGIKKYINASILYTKKIKNTEKTDKYNEFLSLNEQKLNETPLNDDKISQILNEMFKMNSSWKSQAIDNGFKISHNSKTCLVDCAYTHSDPEHSCLFIHKRSAVVSCFSHQKRKILVQEYPQMALLKGELGLIEKKEIKNTIEPVDKYTLTEEDIKHMISKLTTTHEDISNILYRFFGSVFVCGAENPRPIWYNYHEGIWKELEGTSRLRSVISNKLFDIYASLIIICQEQSTKITFDIFEDKSEDYFLNIISLCQEICTKLKTVNFCDGVMRQCIPHFKIDKFIEILDTNDTILCFGKDLYDLNKCEWRETKKEDYCSKCCGVSKEDINDEYIDEFNNIFNDIFPEEARRTYFLNLITETLRGGNIKERFQIWTGCGRNGKGLFMKYFEACLGSYFYTSDISFLTQKTKAGCANSELSQTRGVRIWNFTEPAQDEKLNNSLMKSLSGGDKITTRQLFQSSFTFKPKFTIVIQANTFGLQDVQDDSLPDRLEFIKFKTHFVDEPRTENQRKKIVGIKEDEYINKIKGTLMFILLNNWNVLHKQGFKYDKPQEIKEDKEEFINDNDDVKQFLDDRTEKSHKNDIIKAKDLFDDYKEYSYNKTGIKCKLTLKTFITRCSRHLDFKEKIQPLVNGVQQCIRSVFIFVKYRINE